MKKIILTLFLLTFSLSFSNSDIDIISKELWRCPYSADKTFKGLTYVKFLNENGNPSITFSILDNRAALKTGKLKIFPITDCLIHLIKRIDLKWIYIVFQITRNFAVL